jgi:malonate-semialdehyde dehydrogenase (acetylating)/methylmalonate-semialdehyde dehydrogenase
MPNRDKYERSAVSDQSVRTFNLLEAPKKHYGTLRNYVGGEWVEPETDRYLDVEDPATTETIASVPCSTKADVDRAIQAAQDAFWDWRSTPPVVRARYMFKIKELMEKNFEELSRITTQEHGKAIDEARGETRRTVETVEVASGVTSLMMGYNLEDGAARNIDETVVRQPLGVGACITPFNFPLMMTGFWWPYAIAAGNTFVIKQSEQTPLTVTRFFEILEDADLPDGVMNLVHGDLEASGAILDSPLVQAVGFIGSSPVAKLVYKRCGETGKRICANGGAKNFITVMPDAEIDRSLSNMMASFFGCAGERCLAASVLLAVGDVYDEIKEKFVAAASALSTGPGLDESVNVGPVISAKSLDRIHGYIESGIKEGADLILDGRQVEVPGFEGGHYIAPTVFDNCTPDMTICKDEIFGPVAMIVRVKDLKEAISITNATPFGNAASIYTTSGRSARTFWYEVQSGNIGVNLGVAAPVAYFPFAGQGDSHFGSTHGQRDSFELFTDSKVVITRW